MKLWLIQDKNNEELRKKYEQQLIEIKQLKVETDTIKKRIDLLSSQLINLK